MGALLDALGWVGESLDKPGRAVRGALGGQGFGALKNLVPFSDTAGWTDPSQSLSGRDLLQKWGAIGEANPNEGIGLGDIAGFGVEMALDPTNFIGLGTLKHLGRLRKLGESAKLLSPAGEVAQAAGRGAGLAGEVTPGWMRFLTSEAGTPAYRRTMLGLRPVTAETLEDVGLAAGSKFRPMAERVARFRNVERMNPEQTAQMLALARAGEEMPLDMYGAVIQKGAAPPVGFTAEAAYLPPRKGNRALARALQAGFSEEELAARVPTGTQGIYYPGTTTSPASTAFTMKGAAPEVMRHELGGHAFTREAARIGIQDELPALQRAASKLLGPYALRPEFRGARSGTGMLLDELNAFTKEARNPYSQLAKGAEFLFGLSPADRASYAASLARHSPLAAEMYRDLPYLPYIGLGAAGAGAGGYLAGRE